MMTLARKPLSAARTHCEQASYATARAGSLGPAVGRASGARPKITRGFLSATFWLSAAALCACSSGSGGAVCGDGTCDATEDCTSCAQDCGSCAVCDRDGTCEAGESCQGCPSDCPCCDHDGSCDLDETPASCPDDCRADPQLVQISDFEYAGAFRLPADTFGISELNFSQGPIEVDPAAGSIFIVGHTYQQAIAEFVMPALVVSNRLSELNMASAPRQTFASVLDRARGGNPQAIDTLAALKLVGGPRGTELLVNAYEYYDAPADNTHTTLVVRDPSHLTSSPVDGFFALQGAAHAAGWMSPIPVAWQTPLGGAWLTGSSSGFPIISRLSVGPSAFVFDPLAMVGQDNVPDPVPTTPLLDFSLEHPLHEDLSNETGQNDLWTHLSRAVFGFVVPGTRSYVTLGHSGGHGPGGVCYKCTPTGENEPCGGYCAVDPDDYSLYYWFFDLDDLVAVRQGRKAPHEVRPYAYGPFTSPIPASELGGGAYDPGSGLLYLTLQRADTEQGEYANPPVVAAYRVRSDRLGKAY